MIRLALALVLSLALVACSSRVPQTGTMPGHVPGGNQPTATAGLPVELAEGRSLYRTYCQSCHGLAGAGSEMGPPLIHAHYAPSSFDDEAFLGSVLFGAKQNRWDYGDMLPVAGVERPQIQEISRYIRYLQAEAGIR